MAEKKSRAAARKIKDKWKAKVWYNLLAPEMFNKQVLGETPTDTPDKLVGRVTEVTVQDLKGVFSGDLAKTIAQGCKPIHPVSRVEVRKSEVWAMGEIPPPAEALPSAAEAPAPSPAPEGPTPSPPAPPEPAPEELTPEELPP